MAGPSAASSHLASTLGSPGSHALKLGSPENSVGKERPRKSRKQAEILGIRCEVQA